MLINLDTFYMSKNTISNDAGTKEGINLPVRNIVC